MTSEKQIKPGNIILRIILLLLITAGILVAVLTAFEGDFTKAPDWERLNPKRLIEALQEEHGSIVERAFAIDDFEIAGSGIYLDNLMVLSNSDIRLLNAKGEELWYHTHEIRQPVLQIHGRIALVYEQNGKSYMVLRDGKILLKDKLEEQISYGNITDTRLLFITANEVGYKRTLFAVSPDSGVQLGALYIDDYYPFYLHDMPKEGGENIILSGLGMNSNHVSTIIRLYPGSLESIPRASLELSGIYPVMYRQGHRLLFAGENEAICYNDDLELTWSVSFDQELLAAGLFENGGVVAARKDGLDFYDAKGKVVRQLSGATADSIEICQNTAAVITGNEVVFYDANGNQIGKASLPGLTLKVHFLNEKKAFLVSEHEAILHEIGKNKNTSEPASIF